MNRPKILLVEDDANLGFVIKDNFEQNEFDVDLYTDGQSAYSSFTSNQYDLCIIDIMLPIMDGYALAKEIRKINQDIPLLFLTAKSLKEDKIEGFKIGADDYITKPFSIEELILRCKVFLKRKTSYQKKESSILLISKYTLDLINHDLIFNQESKKLTVKESCLLHLLAKNQNTLVKREDILKELWGDNDYFLGRSMDVFISKLRKYLSSDPNIEIVNYHGLGFKLQIKEHKGEN